MQGTHPFNSSLCNDVIEKTLWFIKPEENIKLQTVCRNWKKVVESFVKLQIYLREKDALESKMAPFLLITGDSVMKYCKDLTKELSKSSAKEVHSYFKNLTIKHRVSVGGHWTFGEESLKAFQLLSSDPEKTRLIRSELKKFGVFTARNLLDVQSRFLQRMEKIVGRVFVDCNQSCSPLIVLDDSLGFRNFPVSLFNIEFQGENHELEHTIGQSCCFPIRGTLHEFIIEGVSSPMPHIDIVAHRPAAIRSALYGLYVPELDSEPLKTNSSQTNNSINK